MLFVRKAVIESIPDDTYVRTTASLSTKSDMLDVCSEISNTNWSFSSVEPVISNILNLEASSFLYNLKCPTIAFDTVPIVSKNVTRLVPCTSISDTIKHLSYAELGHIFRGIYVWYWFTK